jgi:hypothetical protein
MSTLMGSRVLVIACVDNVFVDHLAVLDDDVHQLQENTIGDVAVGV